MKILVMQLLCEKQSSGNKVLINQLHGARSLRNCLFTVRIY